MEEGDILVVGSDGLWDNLFKSQIVKFITQFLRGSNMELRDPALVAEQLALKAERLSYVESYNSPFAKSARDSNYSYIGGKPDDITVIVAQVNLKVSKNQ